MRITHFTHNAFVIDAPPLRVAIDPGGSLYHFRFAPLIPREEWEWITHVLVTHADPDHYWHADRVISRSGATLICGSGLSRTHEGGRMVLGPRTRGLGFTYSPPALVTVDVGERVLVGGMSVTGLDVRHGPLTVTFGPFRKTLTPGPGERIGYGAIGFRIELDGRMLVNLGDTVRLPNAWDECRGADLLMIPIGGDVVGNTMGVDDAVKVVEALKPRTVVPCHHNLPAFLRRNANPTDVASFARAVEDLGAACAVLGRGDSVVV